MISSWERLSTPPPGIGRGRLFFSTPLYEGFASKAPGSWLHMELIKAVTSVPCPATVLPGTCEENPLNITSTFSSHAKESLALLMPSGRFSYPLTFPVDGFIQHTLLTDKLSSICSSLLTGTAISLLAVVNSAPL